MPLKSRTFAGDPSLEKCLIDDRAHLTRGTRGDGVAKVQAVVMFLDGASIAEDELNGKLYGASTAAAVLAYKRKRKIINTAYQQTADEIVGKMTIKALDDELLARQVDHNTAGPKSRQCTVRTGIGPNLPSSLR